MPAAQKIVVVLVIGRCLGQTESRFAAK